MSAPVEGPVEGVDLERVRALVALVSASAISELVVSDGAGEIRLVKRAEGGARPATAPPPDAARPAAVPAPSPASPAPVAPTPAPAGGGAVLSPMFGTFYRAPSPGEPPFVAPGDAVSPGQTLCLVEAMKTLIRIEADRAGVVEAVLVGNGEPVEEGQPLFRIG